ncbi:MAG TPA: hypothetical protein VFY20_03120, partial [Gemmatimonadales bacterium]|nr:hypothetical protein [Gemmatimonadales bacterium]
MPRRLLAALAVVLAACSSDDPGGTDGSSAAVTVSVVPSGVGPQQEYAVSIDGDATGATLGAGASRRFVVETGTRTVALTGLPAWCAADEPAREVRVAEGEEATVRFTVTCTGARVTLTTEGAALDPDGYRLVVDGDDANAAALPLSGTVTVPVLPGERQ